MNHRIKWLGSLGSAALMLALVSSCADGFDSKEVFSAGVSNAQLEAPELNELTTQVNADGSESVVVSWPVIMGAGGYLANVQDVTNPAAPIDIVKDSIIDGCKFTFPREDDSKYEISVATLGNEKLHNKGSLAATSRAYSTMVPATVIPNGSELSQYFAENFVPGTEEAVFELEANGNYTLTGTIDFNLNPVTLRGSKSGRPIVVVSQKEGTIKTQAGLKIRYINFDMSAAEAESFITLCDEPSSTISTEALGFKDLGGTQNSYVIMGQIAIENCNFRNLPKSIIWGNNKAYSLMVFRIDNSIIQMNNATSKTFIDLYYSSAICSCIKTLSLTNSTFYNLVENNSAYFIRYANASNADPQKVFGTGETSTHTISNCTLDRTFTAKDIANNMPTVVRMNIVLENNIFFDVFRLYQYQRSSSVMTANHNVIWYDVAGESANDLKYCDKIDPDFAGPTLEEFNLDLPLGGVNFRPQNSFCVENKIGDPRWFE